MNYIKGLVLGLSAASSLGSAVEVVAVGHGSFFRKLIGERRDCELSSYKSCKFSKAWRLMLRSCSVVGCSRMEKLLP